MSCVSFSRSCQKGGGMGQHVCESANGKPPISKKGYMDKNETERNLLRYTCAICSELSTVHSYCSRNQSGSRDLQWFDCNVTDVSRGSGGGGISQVEHLMGPTESPLASVCCPTTGDQDLPSCLGSVVMLDEWKLTLGAKPNWWTLLSAENYINVLRLLGFLSGACVRRSVKEE